LGGGGRAPPSEYAHVCMLIKYSCIVSLCHKFDEYRVNGTVEKYLLYAKHA